MGPIRSLTALIDEARTQTGEIVGVTDRLRLANRRLTGGTGQPPTQIGAVPAADPSNIKGDPPLMISLTVALNDLCSAMSDLRGEVSYLEQFSETGAPADAKGATTAYGAGRG